MHIVIVGGGPSGTELAGELAVYCRKMCVDVCKIDQSLVTIDLIEAAPRLLGMMPPAFSKAIEMRLRSLGVNILLNRAVMKEELETVYLKDMEMRTKTMVWTAGVKPHRLLGQIQGFTWDKRGRVEVNEYLQAKGFNNVYVLGDGAATQYSGRAQTALRDGEYAGRTIARKLKGLKLVPYVPKDVITAIPIGPGWAGVQWGKMAFYGSIGWFLRRAADFRVYWSILPLRKAITAYRDGAQLCDNYPDCFDMPYAKPQEVAPLAAPALK